MFGAINGALPLATSLLYSCSDNSRSGALGSEKPLQSLRREMIRRVTVNVVLMTLNWCI